MISTLRIRSRDEANENSDLDLLVAREPGRSLLDHAGLVQDLQDLLGMKIHVATEKSLHRYVREQVLREATSLRRIKRQFCQTLTNWPPQTIDSNSQSPSDLSVS